MSALRKNHANELCVQRKAALRKTRGSPAGPVTPWAGDSMGVVVFPKLWLARVRCPSGSGRGAAARAAAARAAHGSHANFADVARAVAPYVSLRRNPAHGALGSRKGEDRRWLPLFRLSPYRRRP